MGREGYRGAAPILTSYQGNELPGAVSQEPQEKDQKGRAMGLGRGWGGCGGWNEWMNEYVVLEKKLKKLEKSYDPAFRELRGNVARKG